jgi:hypothetical protein
MNSQEALQEKLPLVVPILEENGIVPGQYSVYTYLLSPGGEEYGCQVSPTSGNSSLFTLPVQEALTSIGVSLKID